MKNFVKAINTGSPAFAFIRQTFPQVSDAKLNAGIFDGPQIRSLMKDEQFDRVMSETEGIAWQAFKSVVDNFLGKKFRIRVQCSKTDAEFEGSGSTYARKNALSKIASVLFS